MMFLYFCIVCSFLSCRRRQTSCALVTGFQTCALPICAAARHRQGPRRRSFGAGGGGRAAAVPALRAQRGRDRDGRLAGAPRSEEHTSELQSLLRISYAVFCLKTKKHTQGWHG